MATVSDTCFRRIASGASVAGSESPWWTNCSRASLILVSSSDSAVTTELMAMESGPVRRSRSALTRSSDGSASSSRKPARTSRMRGLSWSALAT